MGHGNVLVQFALGPNVEAIGSWHHIASVVHPESSSTIASWPFIFTIIMKVFVSSFIHVGLSNILLDFFITVIVFSMVLFFSFVEAVPSLLLVLRIALVICR